MALDSSKVNIAKTGRVSYAPVGTTAPTDASTPLSADWRDVGYISDDGVTETLDRSVDNINAWQNSDVVRTVVTEASITVGFTMIETNANSVELFYGAPLSNDDGSVDIIPSTTGGRRAVVVDYVDGDRSVRLYLPQAEVTELEEVTLTSSGDPVGYGVTLSSYPDADLGASAKKWFSALAGAGSGSGGSGAGEADPELV